MKACVNGIELHYLVRGTGHPLLMLHGNGEDLHIFDAIADRLERNFTLYLIDSRNHGGSTRTKDFQYTTMAADIAAFIKCASLDKPYVIGFSDGAILALMAEMEEPGSFGKMVLLGPNLHPGDLTDDIMEQLQQAYDDSKDPLVKMMIEQPDIKPGELSKIKVPALIVGGERDIFQPETFTRIAGAMPFASMMIMEGHDHSSYIIGSDLLYGPVREFLCGGSDGPPAGPGSQQRTVKE